MPDESAPKLYRVTNQVPGTRVSSANRFEEGYDVWFVTTTGVEAKVFVPNELYTPENVANLVRSEALRIIEIASLAE